MCDDFRHFFEATSKFLPNYEFSMHIVDFPPSDLHVFFRTEFNKHFFKSLALEKREERLLGKFLR